MKQIPNWVFSLKRKILNSWTHYSLSESVNFQINWDEQNNCWSLSVEPVYQEVIGGHKDGEKVWAGFNFDISKLSKSSGVWIENFLLKSLFTKTNEDGQEETLNPCFLAKGKYYGRKFVLSVYLEPFEDSEVKELVDYKNQIVKRKN